MLKIRRKQMAVFEAAALKSFEDRMVAHLVNFSPKHAQVLDEEQLRTVVRYGIERAESYGLTSERSIRIYTDMMLMLGGNFAVDPQYPWAAEILSRTEEDQTTRIDGLFEKAWDYADHIRADFQRLEQEPHKTRLMDELGNLRKGTTEPLAASGMSRFYEAVIARLNELFPEKCKYLGELSLRRLINRGIELANSYGLSSQRDLSIFVVLMFVLGTGFDRDPLTPWASGILRDDKSIKAEQKADRLYTEALSVLKRWWGPG
jgi:hypothetical protein